jgi:hypothetical protein
MVLDVEELIREYNGREYVVMPGTGVAIPDFLRNEVVIPYREFFSDISAQEVGKLIQNSIFPSAHRMSGGKKMAVCISGEEDFPVFNHESAICMGINRGIFSSVATHAFILDPMGEIIPELRKRKRLPLGIFDIRTSNQTISEWERRSRVGVYRPRPGIDGCDNAILKGIQCQLQEDPLAAAIHFAAKYLGSLDIYLHQADRSYPEPLEGYSMRKIGDRWILPEHQKDFDTLSAVTMILIRNGINLYVTKGSMVELSGANVIDRESLAAEILSGLSVEY